MTDIELRTPDSSPEAPVRVRSAALALLALSVGGFALGTTEFVSMGLPHISAGVGVSIPSAGHAISAYAIVCSSPGT